MEALSSKELGIFKDFINLFERASERGSMSGGGGGEQTPCGAGSPTRGLIQGTMT